jgi:hypothetical protein
VHADGGTPEEALRMLRNEGVYAPLRLRLLWCTSQDMSNLYEGELVDMPAALDAAVDAALTRQVSTLTLSSGGLSPASAPALARLLGSPSLVDLFSSGGPEQQRLLDAAASATLGAALRTKCTLLSIAFTKVDFWRDPGHTPQAWRPDAFSQPRAPRAPGGCGRRACWICCGFA